MRSRVEPGRLKSRLGSNLDSGKTDTPEDYLREQHFPVSIPMLYSRGMEETNPRHPGTIQLQSYFAYDHLPEHLKSVSRPFGQLANLMIASLPDSAELTAGLRKLLEAKDCMVRAAVDDERRRAKL